MIVLDTIVMDECVWLNGIGYSPFSSSQEFSLNGAQIVEVAKKLAGQPIQLFSDAESFETYMQIQEHANTKGTEEFVLTINGEPYQVMWDYSQQPVTGVPSQLFSDADPETIEALTMNLITV